MVVLAFPETNLLGNVYRKVWVPSYAVLDALIILYISKLLILGEIQ